MAILESGKTSCYAQLKVYAFTLITTHYGQNFLCLAGYEQYRCLLMGFGECNHTPFCTC